MRGKRDYECDQQGEPCREDGTVQLTLLANREVRAGWDMRMRIRRDIQDDRYLEERMKRRCSQLEITKVALELRRGAFPPLVE